MEFYANTNKKIEIGVGNKIFFRHAIKMHFVTEGEDYIKLVKDYVEPIYREGDVVFSSEKIVSLCQKRVVYKKNMKIGFWAKLLSKFVKPNPAGVSLENPYKMQTAINLAGLPRIIFAAVCAAVGKLFGRRGVFYNVAGHGVAGVDGFNKDAYDFYDDRGILLPERPNELCNEIKKKLNIETVIVDANDLGVEILGKPDGIRFSDEELKAIIKDNPAGQKNQQTPLILAREYKPEVNGEVAAVTE